MFNVFCYINGEWAVITVRRTFNIDGKRILVDNELYRDFTDKFELNRIENIEG